jgi:ATP-dependent Zn protease
MVARFIAGRLDLPFYQVSADEFGSDASLLHRLFRRLASERAILFIDEVSVLAQKREWGDADDRRMLSALLTCLDGLGYEAGRKPLWVIGACTADIALDPAIHRSGRLGVVVEFALPSEAQRLELLRLYLRRVPNLIDPEDLERLAEIAVGATGADIHDWINQAASEALAETHTADPLIEYRHLESVVARKGFVAAEGRPGRAPDWETAIHESAHAVAAYTLFGRDALAKVSVGFGNPRGGIVGRALGHFSLSDDWLLSHPPTSATWLAHAGLSLAGMVAENLFLGYRGYGADADVAHATEVILGQLDSGDPSFGPSRTVVESSSGVLGAPAGSEAMRASAWAIARLRFAQVEDLARQLVGDRREAVEHVARILLESKAMLTGEEIAAAIDRQTLTGGRA